ncbi:MAG: DUF6491 family protein [Maricaulaceae bacterium]
MLKHFLPIAGLTLAAACANAAPQTDMAAEDDCFNVRNIIGYNVIDDDTVRLEVIGRGEYELELVSAECNSILRSERIALDRGPSAGAFACVSDLPETGRILSDEDDVCRIVSARRIEPEEMETDDPAAGD